MNHPLRKLWAFSAVALLACVAGCSDDDDNNNGNGGGGGSSLPLLNEALSNDARFSTFVQDLDASGVTASLQGSTVYTVFAPTNEAFDRLPAGALDTLGTSQAGVLQYHIVPGSIARSELVDGATFTTVQGEVITIRRYSTDDLVNADDDIYVDGLVLINNDQISARNGLIYAADAVLFPPSVTFPGTLADLVAAYPSLSSTNDALANAGLTETVATTELTLLAPTNQAFTTVSEDDLSALLNPDNQADLINLLTYHALPGTQLAEPLTQEVTVDSVLGPRVAFASVDDRLQVNDALSVRTDFRAQNGVMQAIDGVLHVPGNLNDELIRRDDLATFNALIDEQGLRAGLTDPNADTTVFAFTDDAWEAFSSLADDPAIGNIMAYHLVSGTQNTAMLGQAGNAATPLVTHATGDNQLFVIQEGTGLTLEGVVQFERTNIVAQNGIIHIIDAVLLPTEVPFPGDLVDAVETYSVFTMLNQALEAANLKSTLRTDNGGLGYTFFAPTNAAFAEAGITDLSTLDVNTLNAVLLNHVVSGELLVDALVGMPSITPVGGGSTVIVPDGGTVQLGGAAVVIGPNIQTDNGILHVIDNVLTP